MGTDLAGGLAGCAVGPGSSRIVIETGEPRPADGNYARALALRLNQADRARTSTPETLAEDSRR